MRVWLARTSAAALLLGGLALLLSLSLLLATLFMASEDEDGSAPYRSHRPRLFWLTLASLRAVLGSEAFPRQPDNRVHDLLASMSSLVGGVVPALVIGVVLVRLFTVRAFEWRRHLNACLAAEMEGDRRTEASDGRHAYLAVRWYKRLENLSVINLHADAYLRCRTVSTVDGSTLYRYQHLKVLNLDGHEDDTCVWPETFSGMPFTLWIPLHATLVDGHVAKIQGRQFADGDDRQLVVRLWGRIAGVADEINDECRYSLTTDVQVGRFVPVEPVLATSSRTWTGWRRFDERLTHGVFLYGSTLHPADLLAILGHWPRDGEVQRATLHGYRRSWRVCTDNTDPHRRATYVSPGDSQPDPIQVLFVTVLPDPGSVTSGLLVHVDAEQLAALDVREGNYLRRKVTDSVTLEQAGGSPLDVMWTYVAAPDRTARADAAIVAGTARIRKEYLDHLLAGLAEHDRLLEEFEREAPPPDVPTVPLTRLPSQRRTVEPQDDPATP